MLKLLSEQGADTVIATPHFYANREPVDKFLARRDEAWKQLECQLPSGSPRVVCGAEVLYYPGVGRMSGLRQLCIGGTDMLLLEMPMAKWTEYTVRELVEMSSTDGITLVLAHIDRYWNQQSRSTWDRLYDSGILMQVNASFFLEFLTRRKALSLLEDGGIHLLGSDCHNLSSRPPRIGAAVEVIRKKLGTDFLCAFSEFGEALLR